jgi:peptidoglycan/LPS O-acetylase OafA/YrhL
MFIQKSYGLDIIRILANLVVIIVHLIISFADDFNYTNYAIIIGVVSVEVFFCLSGYLVCKQGIYIVSSKNNYNKNTIIFILRRILRTWPAYFFALLSYIFFYRYFEDQVVFYLFFLQNLFYPMVSSSFFPVSWSICVEELFYLTFPFLLCFLVYFFKKTQITIFNNNLLIIFSCFLIILIVFFSRINLTYENWGNELRRVSFFRIDAIAFGGLGFFIIQKYFNFKHINLLFLLLLVSSLIILVNFFKYYIDNGNFYNTLISNNFIFYFIYIFCISLIFLFDKIIVIKKTITKNIISEIANWTYPLYLMHLLIIDLIKKINIENLFVNIFLIILLNILLAYVIRKYIELPFLKIRPKYCS